MENVIYIGTGQGVVTARGKDPRSWAIESQGVKGWSVSEVASSPDKPNRVFAGTRGDGVWLSEDFGKTWKKPCYGKRGPGKVRSLTIDPNDSRRIYAGCEPIDVFVSEDEGRNWTRLDGIWDIPFVATIPYPLATVEPHVRDVTVDPSDPNTIYAALQIGYIVKSTDAGKTWTLLDNKVDCDVHTVSVDPRNSRRLCITTGGHDARGGRSPGRALYTSNDGGASWAPAAMNFKQEYAVVLTVDPHDPKLMYSALGNGQPGQWMRRDSGAESIVIRSTDGGDNWSQLGLCADSPDFPEAFLADDQVKGRVFAAYHKGAFHLSEDRGESWQPIELKAGGNLMSAVLVHA